MGQGLPPFTEFPGTWRGYIYFDDHTDKHFHLRHHDGTQATVIIQTGEIIGELPRWLRRKLAGWVLTHQEELLDNWNRVQNGQPPRWIKPD